jgi:hypothetical protein
VVIGVSANNSESIQESINCLPGYSLDSVGWHADDGNLYKDGQVIK